MLRQDRSMDVRAQSGRVSESCTKCTNETTHFERLECTIEWTMAPKAPLLPTTPTARPGLVDLSPSKRQSRSAKENEDCTSRENLALQAKQTEHKACAL